MHPLIYTSRHLCRWKKAGPVGWKSLPKRPATRCSGSVEEPLPRDARNAVFWRTQHFKSSLTAKSIAARLGADKAEAKIVVPVSRVVVVPIRRTDVPVRVVPASAANHAVRPRGRAHTVQYYGNSGNAQAANGPWRIRRGCPPPPRPGCPV